MRVYKCDLCGADLGVAFADGHVTKKGTESGAYTNTLQIKSWKTIAEQASQVECAYDLCEDCAKVIHRKLMFIANNYTWRNKDSKRTWETNGKESGLLPLYGADIEGKDYKICANCSAIVEDGDWRAHYCPDCGTKVYWEEGEEA